MVMRCETKDLAQAARGSPSGSALSQQGRMTPCGFAQPRRAIKARVRGFQQALDPMYKHR
jgi:hypothetical protein